MAKREYIQANKEWLEAKAKEISLLKWAMASFRSLVSLADPRLFLR